DALRGCDVEKNAPRHDALGHRANGAKAETGGRDDLTSLPAPVRAAVQERVGKRIDVRDFETVRRNSELVEGASGLVPLVDHLVLYHGGRLNYPTIWEVPGEGHDPARGDQGSGGHAVAGLDV